MPHARPAVGGMGMDAMNAPRPLRRAFVLVATTSLTMTLAGIAPAGVSGQDERSFNASISDDRVSGWGFACPVTVTLTGRGGSATYPVTDACSVDGFDLFLDPSEQANPWDVLPGQTITVTDNNALSKSLVVANLAIVGYDLVANTIWGTSDSVATVSVSTDHAGIGASVDGLTVNKGAWIADFNTSLPPYDLRVMDRATASQCDSEGDCTEIGINALAGPRFGFGLETLEVIGYGWPAGVTVTLTIDRPDTLESPDFKATTTAAPEPFTDTFLPMGNGNVYFQLAAGPFHPLPGDVMTMAAKTAGVTITKRQLIPNLAAYLPDYDADAVAGTATVPAGSFLTVGSDYSWNDPAILEVPGGEWTADFAGMYDIGPGSQPWAYVTDEDGDSAASLAPMPQMFVDPAADRVWAADFTAGPVILTITRGETTLAPITVSTTNVFSGDCMRLDMWTQPTGTLPRPTMALFDLKSTVGIEARDVLTATDVAGSTRTITVDYLTVEAVDPATDTISGRADAPVGFHMGMGCSGYWGYPAAVPDSAGQWSYFFDSSEFPFQGVEPGSTGYAIGQSWTTIVAWKDPSFFFPPVNNPPLENTVTAGRSIDVTFSLGGNRGLDIFAPGYPVSKLGASETPTSGRLTYNTKTGRYTYVWRTERALAGTERELILRFPDGSEQRAIFNF